MRFLFFLFFFWNVFYVVSPASRCTSTSEPVLPAPSSEQRCCVRPRPNRGDNEDTDRSEKTQKERQEGKVKAEEKASHCEFVRVVYPATHFTKPTRRSPYHNRTSVIAADNNARRTSSFAHRQIKIADVMSSNCGRKHPPVLLWPSNLQHLPPSSVRNATWPVETLSALQSH